MDWPRRPRRFEVPLAKVTDYLLNQAHPVGKSKARYFMNLGYSPDRPQPFIEALVIHGQISNVHEVRKKENAYLMAVKGPLLSPKGKPTIITVWYLEEGSETARLVTAYPGG